MNIAITREVSAALGKCETTFVARTAIDVDVARAQHQEYSQSLEWAGLTVVRLPALDNQPDACFVEDTALVLDETAIVTSMGSASRRPETPSVEAALRRYRRIEPVTLPATIEGGDVVRVGRTLFVGRSSRTNREGVLALADIAGGYGYRVVPVEVRGCLHLKTACTALTPDTLLVNPAWIDPRPFTDLSVEHVPAAEPWGANVLVANGRAILHHAHEYTATIVQRLGLETRAVDIGEFMKAEAGVTCLSLIFAHGPA